jgi:hypothetical protein
MTQTKDGNLLCSCRPPYSCSTRWNTFPWNSCIVVQISSVFSHNFHQSGILLLAYS